VFDLSERISVMYHGKLVGTVNKNDVTTDEVLGMIILGKPPTKLTQQELAELHG
jgi:D-xylose transport system ATP-binding protein